MINHLKAVSFDAGGTLIHLAEPVGETYARIAKANQIEAEPKALDSAFRQVWSQTPAPFQPGCCRDDTEREWWSNLVREVFDAARARGPIEQHFDTFFDVLYDHYGRSDAWILDKEALAIFDHLNEHDVKLAIISNFDERLLSILEGFGILSRFSSIVLSSQVRASKPDPRLFQKCLHELKLNAAQLLHVGDDPVCDIEAAKAMGIAALHIGKGFGRLTNIIEHFRLQSNESRL